MISRNHSSAAEPRQAPRWPAPLLVKPANLLKDGVCPKARSLEALIIGSATAVLIGLSCKRWSCRPCADFKIRSLAVRCKLAAPNRLLTLTVDPSLYDNPRQAFVRTAPQVPELIRHLRSRFGQVEYLRVTELTHNGWPHYHLLVRSGYLPHAVVKALWNRCTGAQIVDIRQVDQRFAAYTYLCKYLSKMHHLSWTDRHVSFSKDFFLRPEDPEVKPQSLAEYKVYQQHPHDRLLEYWSDQWITQTGPMAWILAEPDPDLSPPTATFT